MAIEAMEGRVMLDGAPKFDWAMEDRLAADQETSRIQVPNASQYANPGLFKAIFDVSGLTLSGGLQPSQFTFDVRDSSGNPLLINGQSPVFERVGDSNLKWSTRLPESDNPATANVEEAYSVTIRGSDGTAEVSATQAVPINDILIVAIGDSYSSGEGTPEVARTGSAIHGQWMVTGTGDSRGDFEHRIAHRSSFAPSAQMALQIEQSDPKTSVTFVFLSASGGEITGSIFPDPSIVDNDPTTKGIYQGIAHEYLPALGEDLKDQNRWLRPQLDQLDDIVGNRKIDTMTISFGGNDIGFANIIAAMLLLDTQDPDQWGNEYFEARASLLDAVNFGQAGSTSNGRWEAFFREIFPVSIKFCQALLSSRLYRECSILPPPG